MGCSGAGKTTIATGVVARLRAGGLPVADHCVRRSGPLVAVGHAAEFPVAGLSVLRQGPAALPFLSMAWAAVRRRSGSRFRSSARMASLVRILGARARWARTPWVTIVDEGMLGTAHLLFVGGAPPAPEEMDAFVRLASLPDVAVWVDAPVHEMQRRTLARLDAPREWRREPPARQRDCVERAAAVFRQMAGNPHLAPRVIAAPNPRSPPEGIEAVVSRVVDALRERLASWPA